MFLLKVQQELKMRQTEEMSRFYQSETVEAEPKTTLSAKGVAAVVVVVAIVSIIFFLIPIDVEWKVAVPTIGTLGTFLLALLNGLFYDLKISYSKPALFAPEQFEECFKSMMGKCLKEKNWLQKTWNAIKDYVEVGEVSVVGLEELVIVIDNIDRCPSDMAYQLLTDIKTFLSNEEYNLVFIVPVDDEALKKHLFRRWNKQTGEDINKEKEEFLRKFFNVTLRIKPHQVTELLHFAHEINKENNLGYSNDTLAIVAKEFADNPRRIIQLLNNLSSDLALYEADFAQKYETTICAALILHEEYPTFYKEATKNLLLVSKFKEDYAKDKDGKVNESLLAFMRVADMSLKQTSLDVLQRIFTNTTSIFSDLPSNVQKSVTTYDASKVIEFANSNEGLKANLVDFAIEKLSNDVKYGATTQTTKWIDFLAKLFKAGLFDGSRFNIINATLSTYYNAAIPVIEDLESLCYLGSQMAKVGITALRSAIIEYLTADKAAENANFKNVLYAYYSNFQSEQDCKEIATVVENYYLDNYIDRDIAFTDTQKTALFGDSFVTKQIGAISKTDDESHIELVVWCINNNSDLLSETFTTLFAKFIELFGNTRGKGKADFLTFINHLQVLFDALPTRSLTNELADIYGVVTNARAIPHPSWPTQSQHDSHRSILDEVDEEEAKTVTSFCYGVMRITGGRVNISAAISKLYAKCKDAVVDGALKIHSLGISIKPLASTLISADDFVSTSDISILEIILTRQEDGSFMLAEDTIKEKIQSLVNHADDGNVESLLKKLVTDKQILDIVAEYVATLNSETINSLPVSIAKFAVSTFRRENAEIYKDNVDFLSLVLKQGSASQKREVVRLMKAKINVEVDLDNVVLVLNNLVTEDQQLLKPLVSELDAIKDSETVSNETKSKIADLSRKLSINIEKVGFIDKMLGKE